jgi:hypothetical protein
MNYNLLLFILIATPIIAINNQTNIHQTKTIDIIHSFNIPFILKIMIYTEFIVNLFRPRLILHLR